MNSFPEAGDIAVIGFVPFDDPVTAHRGIPQIINVNTATIACAQVLFTTMTDASGDPVASNDDRFFASRPSLNFNAGPTANLTADIIKGEGLIFISNADPNLTSIDMGEFVSEDSSYVFYEIRANGVTLNNVPDVLPNLILGSDAFGVNDYDLTISKAIQTNGNLELLGNVNFVMTNAASGDVTVVHDLIFYESNSGLFPASGGGAELVYPNASNARTVTVQGDVTMDNAGALVWVDTPGTTPLAHTLSVTGNITQNTAAGGTDGLLLWTATNDDNITLTLTGENDASYTRTSGDVPDLYRIIMNKGVDTTYTFTLNDDVLLSGPTNTTRKTLILQNGKIVFDDADFAIDLTTGVTDFSIPREAGLIMTQGVAYVSGDDTGIALNGLLRINGGEVNLDVTDVNNPGNGMGENGNNYIEYGNTGTAKIDISSGTLTTGSQVRRNTTLASGVLTYSQSGGTVEIGTGTYTSFESSRGMFEVLNAGSQFNLTGGSFTIINQNTANPEVAALLLDPATFNTSGSTITMGNGSTAASQTDFGINSAVALNNLILNGTNSPDFFQEVNTLELAGNLTINTGGTLDTNGFGLIVGGSMVNDGTFTPNSNLTTFSSNAAQSISGSGTTSFYDLTKTGSGVLSTTQVFTISNNFDIDAGTFSTGTQSINLLGDFTVDGTLTGTSGNGLIFSGSSVQNIGRSAVGISDLGIITINNANGIQILDGNSYDFNITTNLRLEDGVFDIGGNLVTIETTAGIVAVNPFAVDNMVRTNSSFGDNGLKKDFAASTTTDFIFPIGESSYSPVTIDLSSGGHTSGNTLGSITIRAASEYHPIVDNGVDFYASGDVNNVLQFYWVMDADNLDAAFEGDIIFQYIDADVKADEAGQSEANYITARILSDNNPTGAVNKAGGTVDTGGNTLTFAFSGSDHQGMSGDYFAGIDLAIPNTVPTYTATSDGNIGDAIYSPVVPGGGAPSGAIVVVDPGVTVTFDVPNVSLYQTEINGTLTIDATTGHRLGTVTGTGDIRLVSNITSANLPAGFYPGFFTCGGGGLEYDGSGNYQVMGGINTVDRLTINGSNTKTLAGNEIIVCNDFTVNNTVTFDNSSDQNITVMNDLILNGGTFNAGSNNVVDIDGDMNIAGGDFDHESSGTTNVDGNVILSTGSFDAGSGGEVTMGGNFTFSGGTFNGGDGTSRIVMQGASTQLITGTFTGTSHFHGLEFDNTSGITFASDANFDNEVIFTDGIVEPGSNVLTFNGNATASPAEGTATSFIQGPASKVITNAGSGFTFPVGSDVSTSRWGYASVSDVSSGGLTWTVEYFSQDPTTDALVDNKTPADPATIKTISNVEYWKISDGNPGTSGVTATIGLRWDIISDVSATMSERETLQVMVWNDGNTNWDNYGGQNFASGHTQASGSYESSTVVGFSEQIITLGSEDEDNPLPVELVFFEALADNNIVTLKWRTATEINNDYFEVERSADGIEYEYIGNIDGSGNSTIFMDYEFIDERPYFGISYYRLRQVDFDGREEVSPSEIVDNDYLFSGIALTVYPNPTYSDNINIAVESGDLNSPFMVQIISTTAIVVYQQVITPENLRNNLRIEPSGRISPGIYFLRIQQGKNTDMKRVIIRE